MFCLQAIYLLIILSVSESKVSSSVEDITLFVSSQRSFISELGNFILEEQKRIKYLTLYGIIL